MLDDLRNTAYSELPEDEEQTPLLEQIQSSRSLRSQRKFLGMTAPQRLVIAILLLLMTCVLGVLCLVATGRVWV
ncbi:MAG: hypothetical protein AB1453_13000 [Chloroflexota bacterium]|jgi:hypothetical protein